MALKVWSQLLTRNNGEGAKNSKGGHTSGYELDTTHHVTSRHVASAQVEYELYTGVENYTQNTSQLDAKYQSTRHKKQRIAYCNHNMAFKRRRVKPKRAKNNDTDFAQ